MADMNRIIMLFAIVGRGKGKKYMDMLSAKGICLHMQMTAHGTAPSEMMDIFGLGNTDKDIVISYATEQAGRAYVEEITKNVGVSLGFGGLLMCFRLSAINRLTAEIVNRSEADSEVQGGTKRMANTHKQQLILVTVNQGFTNQVMQTAKKAGAMGGTILRARLASADKVEQYGEIAAQEEKEIIAILAPVGTAAKIMEEVNKEHGFHTDACGMITALPVDKAYKI